MLKTGLVFTFVSSFMALFPVANPIGGGFIINGFLSGLNEQDRLVIIRKIVVNYILVGFGSLIVGHLLLTIFSLSIPVVQLGGGLLICKTAISWLSDSDSSTKDVATKTSASSDNLTKISSQAFYPITFPISIGPGSISVIFTLMASGSVKGSITETLLNYLIIAIVIVMMCAILFVFLTQGEKVMKRLGRAGNLVINKMVAFFTFCIGIQIVLEGVTKIFKLDTIL